ncbi:MAG: phage tail protein [Proteobacteria bacterium]|nr:phage tail protein [Pseudomonadota bacterium]
MSSAYIGEIRLFGFGYTPKGWAQCNGQLVSIQQNQALFSILGTTFGGNGVQNFALPDLRGRVPMHWGMGTVIGQVQGEENHTLQVSETPAHMHLPVATSNTATATGPVNNVLAASSQNPYSATLTNPVTLQAATVTPTGGSQPHENRQPYTVVNACIALVGIFPSRN